MKRECKVRCQGEVVVSSLEVTRWGRGRCRSVGLARQCRRTVLEMVRNIPMDGHLEKKKTLDRIQRPVCFMMSLSIASPVMHARRLLERS